MFGGGFSSCLSYLVEGRGFLFLSVCVGGLVFAWSISLVAVGRFGRFLINTLARIFGSSEEAVGR